MRQLTFTKSNGTASAYSIHVKQNARPLSSGIRPGSLSVGMFAVCARAAGGAEWNLHGTLFVDRGAAALYAKTHFPEPNWECRVLSLEVVR